jgi:hypothetical protein
MAYSERSDAFDLVLVRVHEGQNRILVPMAQVRILAAERQVSAGVRDQGTWPDSES